uniref:PlsC domain-containing protein n=1 Tax=Angiostrongylus cantonensis TaxID=6313 RepID=A0A158P9M1_ANGCA
MFGRSNGVIFALLLFLTSFLGSIFLLFPLLPLAYYGSNLWRKCADRLVGFWLTFPVCLVECFFNTKFHVTGDLILRDKPALIIMNHRTRISTRPNCRLLLFPEGTDRSARSAAQSDSYALQNGLPRYNYLLHPRTTGFNHFLTVMREANYISYVYDVTVAYEDVIVDSEIRLIKEGTFPKNVHFNVKKYDIKDIPNDVEKRADWLRELWFKKEKKLKKFYEADARSRRLDPSGDRYVWPPMGVGEPPVVADGQPFWIRLRGWAFCTFTLISALLGSIYIITPLLPLLFVNPRCWRKCMDRLVGVWVAMPAALMTYMFGAKVRVRGDMIDHSKPAVIIMNHRSRLDWLYFWNALFTMDPWLCTSEKITLKGVLKYLPGAEINTEKIR